MRAALLSVTATTSLMTALLLPGGLQAQRPRHESTITINRGSFAVEPFAGYMIGQSFLKGPLNTSLGGSGAAVYGAEASLPLTPSSSLVGQIAYGNGDLKAGVPIFGGIDLGSSSALLLDASVELRAESYAEHGGRFVPFVQLGGGAIHRTVSVIGIDAHATDFEVSGGVGANIPIASNISVRLLAKDYYGKADFGTADFGSLGSFDAKTDDLHTFTFTGGLRFTF